MSNTIFIVEIEDKDMKYIPDVCTTYDEAKEFAFECLHRQGINPNALTCTRNSLAREISDGADLLQEFYCDNNVTCQIVEREVRGNQMPSTHPKTLRHYSSVEVDTNSMQLFRNGQEILCPVDIHKAYMIMCTFEYIKENYSNTDDELWDIACEARTVQDEYEANGYPITESEAIEIAEKNLGITLVEA